MSTRRAALAVCLIALAGVLLYDHTTATASSAQTPAEVLSTQATPTPIPTPFPITPPDASLIAVSQPDDEGYATVTGAAGAVQANSSVIVINLSARDFMTTTADATGAFTTNLYAPPGSSLLIKYDPEGSLIRWFWELGQTEVAGSTIENLNPLPGTILYVGRPSTGDGQTQPFYAVSAFMGEGAKGWAGWAMTGTLQVPPGEPPPGLTAQRGQPITVTAKVRVTSPAITCTGTPTYHVNALGIGLRYLFDADGRPHPWDNWFNTFLFSPTGLPIEHEAGGEVWRTNTGATLTSLTCVSNHAFEGDLEFTLTVPITLPDGIYRPEAWLLGTDVPQSQEEMVAVVWYNNYETVFGLPSFRVGSPAPPRIPWTLLSNYPVNGHRGVDAQEDRGDYALSTRVLIPPHQAVIPRLDERTGEPLNYQLEPESYWVSGTERRLPNPPHIPLDLPSGQLTIEVIKPDDSVDQLGPTTINQPSVRTPTVPGGSDLDEATGEMGDIYQLATRDEAFAYTFDQYGPHTIAVWGEVNDIYGNTYAVQGTYELIVARVLDLDPGQLPTTPYKQGDAVAPGLHLFPPVPAEVHIHLTHMPYSDPDQAITATIVGQANRFGYFQPPPGIEMRLDSPGEFRLDYSAFYEAPDGTLWAGAMTWGNVVEGPTPMMEAHGRRGLDYKDNTINDMPAWFEVLNLPPAKLNGALEVYYPYFSGDVHWGDETPDRSPGDSIHTIISVKDLTGASEIIYNTLRDHFARATNCYRWPPMDCDAVGLEKRIEVGEAPLFITTQSGIDAGVAPEQIDLWGYWYGSSERPDVRVREILSEDGMGTAYWRFNDTYGYQIGEPADGDQPGDLKWEFGGTVLRTINNTIPLNEYAIYSSLWVLLPHDDPVGARITPPFQDATGASINGGPIMTLLGQEIDMLFLPKGVRPGDVLELGEAIAFSGHVGPPLDSRVDVTITSPGGATYSQSWHANKIGWLYDPSFDFVANEVGRWTVDVFVEHDRPYPPIGVTPQSHNTGTVLGTSGRYEFYVVDPGAPALHISAPEPGFIVWSDSQVKPVEIQGRAPAGTTAVYYTIHDKGVVMGQGSLTPGPGGFFTLVYDARALHEDFPMLSLTAREGRWEGLADEVSIHLLAVGAETPCAAAVTLIGEEVFVQGGEDPGGFFPIYLPLVTKN